MMIDPNESEIPDFDDNILYDDVFPIEPEATYSVTLVLNGCSEGKMSSHVLDDIEIED